MNVDIYKCHAFKRQVWNFSNVDVSGLNNALLGFNWNQLFENQSNIDVAYQKWYSQFRHIVERFIPLKIVPIKPKDKPWMTGEIRLAIRKRDRYLRTYNNNKLSVAWEHHRKQRNQTVSFIRCAKKAYFDKINHDLSDPKIRTKKWWSISKRLCGGNEVTSIPAIVEDGVTVS